jgi:hypothetical protein
VRNCAIPAGRRRRSLRDRGRNGMREKLHFSSRINRITRSSPFTKNIPLAYF